MNIFPEPRQHDLPAMVVCDFLRKEAETGDPALGQIQNEASWRAVALGVGGGVDRKLKPRRASFFVSAATDTTLRDLPGSERRTSVIGTPFTIATPSHLVRQTLGDMEPS